MSTLETLLIVFIVVTGLAVVIQTGVLLAFYLALRKSSARIETFAADLESRALPALELAREMHIMLQEYRPKLDNLVTNATETSDLVKRQVKHVDATLTEIVDRTRAQAALVDAMFTRTLERVEDTTELVRHSLIGPLRQVGGVLQGISVGLGAFFRKQRSNLPVDPSKDEGFI
jgi:methyl-accepting chemotaxis protein